MDAEHQTQEGLGMFSRKIAIGAALSLAVVAGLGAATMSAQATPTSSPTNPSTTQTQQWQIENGPSGKVLVPKGGSINAHPNVAAGTPGIGLGVWTTIDDASLFQCPQKDCNQGSVAIGYKSKTGETPDDVAAICFESIISPWGDDWVLVLDHNNNEVGFLDYRFIIDPNPSNGGVIPACNGS